MMVAYNFLDTYLPTGYCRIVKPRKSKPSFPFHSSFGSRVWAYRVLASFSSNPMPLSHSWIVSLHRWMAVAQKSPCEEKRVIMGQEFPLKLGQRGQDAREEVPMRTPKR